ncbi:MAG: hypothetical protein JXB26_03555 [Candidatus Aminicenantes bacterium]|nr:hypothetical protein [Candidatus Aminicenantes bacterium]
MNFFKEDVGQIYPWGEPVLPHLLCYSLFAVPSTASQAYASHLRQAWLVNNTGQYYFSYLVKLNQRCIMIIA